MGPEIGKTGPELEKVYHRETFTFAELVKFFTNSGCRSLSTPDNAHAPHS